MNQTQQEELIKRARTKVSYLPYNNTIIVRTEQIITVLDLSTAKNIIDLADMYQKHNRIPIAIKNEVVGYGYSVYGVNIGDDIELREGGVMLITIPENEESFEIKRAKLGGMKNIKFKTDSKVMYKGVELAIPDADLLDIHGNEIKDTDKVDEQGNKLGGLNLATNQQIKIVEYCITEAHSVLGVRNPSAEYLFKEIATDLDK